MTHGAKETVVNVMAIILWCGLKMMSGFVQVVLENSNHSKFVAGVMNSILVTWKTVMRLVAITVTEWLVGTKMISLHRHNDHMHSDNKKRRSFLARTR
jgi:hypothetical protein